MRAGHARSLSWGPWVGVVAALTAGCEAAEPQWTSPIAFDTSRAWVHSGADSTPLLVEVARTDEQKRYGLMMRPTLDAESGMIFVYQEDQPDSAAFWMFRTRVPLDIAFIDSLGVISAIGSMDPCPNPDPLECPNYLPGLPYRSALEVNRGWFTQHGVLPGARVTMDSVSGP